MTRWLLLLAGCRTPAIPAAEGRWLDSGAPTVDPREGRWLLEDVHAEAAGCDLLSVVPLEDAGLKIKPTGRPDDFELYLEPLEAGAWCQLAGDGFACDTLSLREAVDGVDATLSLQLANEGWFIDAAELTGRLDGVLDCAGSACALEALSTLRFPCEVQLGYSALHESRR